MICPDFLFLLKTFLLVKIKRILKSVFFIAVFHFCTVPLFAQNQSNCFRSTEGTDFWFGFMESRNYIESHSIKVLVTSRESTNFTIYIGQDENIYGTYSIIANIPVEITIPWQMVEASGSENKEDKGIHLVSEKPVNVYAFSWDRYSSDAAVIYPVETLGFEYFAMCYFPTIDPRNPESGSGRNSEFLIVATENDTRVEITPSKVTDNLIPKDSTFSVILNKGQIFQVQSQNIMGTDKEGQGDLTGSHVYADKPIAFFSGALGTTVPRGECCWDHLFEQIPPVHAWGREYYAVSLKSREKDIYRILASKDNTTVRISGLTEVRLNRGEYYEFSLPGNSAKQIFADKRILAAQFSMSHDTDSTFTEGNGDPFMLVLNSTEQWTNEVAFESFAPPVNEIDTTYAGIKKHFVNIITKRENVAGIYLDGRSVQNEFQPFPGFEYSFARIETTPGNHQVNNVFGENGFLAYAYGFGKWESYGYSAGFNMNYILDLGENIEFFEKDTLLLCHGDTLTLEAGPQFNSYQWNTGETTPSINVTSRGPIWVKATTASGCDYIDSVYIYKSSPETGIDSGLETLCQSEIVPLEANYGYEKYIWQNEIDDTLSTSPVIVPESTGEYRITVIDSFRCETRDTLSLIIHPVPEVKITGENFLCGIDTSTISVTIEGTADSIWNFPGSTSWSSSSEAILVNEISQKQVKIRTLEYGDYEVYFNMKTIDNCETIDTFKIRFHPQPQADFIFGDNELCNDYNKKLIFTGMATDSAFFEWDLDGLSFLDTLDVLNRIYNVSVGASREKFPVISLRIDDNGCLSNEFEKTLEANSNFEMNADNIRGCDSLTVNFSAKMLTTDEVEYTWTFDDTEIVNEQYFSKTYSDTGFYKVNLIITNPETQCKNSFTIDSMIKVFPTPVAEISVDPNICYPDSILIFYTNSIDSSICKWVLEGIKQWGDGNDSINVVIEQPTGNVALTVDEYGCISKPIKKEIRRKPLFDFDTGDVEGCQPYAFEVKAITNDKNIDFTWITDSLPYPTGESALYYLPDTGRFDITLMAYSNQTGCADTLLKQDWIKVHRNPWAKFAIDYFWDFGDSITSNEFEPVHTYTELGTFNPMLFVEAESGCRDTFGLFLEILPSEIYAPNAFRPNSDIQENRTFMPVNMGVDETKFSLKIFNRWGDLVFESNSIYDPWDGTHKNGGEAPIGNYVWIANYFDVQGFEHNEKGQVLLIR